MREILCIFFGGGVGSICRYALGAWLASPTGHPWPWGTYAANVLGCFSIGLLMSYFCGKPGGWWQLLLITGFCGGFTTFSTLSNETFLLLRQGLYLWSLAYAVLSLLSGLCSVALGFALGNLVWKTV